MRVGMYNKSAVQPGRSKGALLHRRLATNPHVNLNGGRWSECGKESC